MSEAEWHAWAALGVMAAGLVVVLVLRFISAPYGRHGRPGWGPTLSPRLGWVLMEAPALLVFVAVYLLGAHAWEPAPLLLLGTWTLHYGLRAFVYPLRIRGDGRRMPLPIALSGAGFNLVNAGLNARWVSELGDYAGWLRDPRLALGLAVFALGFGVNQWADAALLRLREGAAPGTYRVPRGGLFRYVSCPNYLGEILEWLGWAVATWSLAGLAFAVFTLSNLGPRALSHHRWYQERFPDYPPERRALLPFLL